jgi:hypothetical protein
MVVRHEMIELFKEEVDFVRFVLASRAIVRSSGCRSHRDMDPFGFPFCKSPP